MAFELPKLPYAVDALEPYIDAQTMTIHHDKHHAAYVTNLNAQSRSTRNWPANRWRDSSAISNAVPEDVRMVVRNHGGGTWNHSMFWKIMGPKAGGMPKGELAKAIDSAFKSFDNFKTEFEKAANTRFGSGWAWLVKKGNGLAWSQPRIRTTRSPMAPRRSWGSTSGSTPTNLKYQNRRAEYVTNWWNVVNWDAVASRYAAK